MSISEKLAPFWVSNRLAAWQKPQRGDVYDFNRFAWRPFVSACVLRTIEDHSARGNACQCHNPHRCRTMGQTTFGSGGKVATGGHQPIIDQHEPIAPSAPNAGPVGGAGRESACSCWKRQASRPRHRVLRAGGAGAGGNRSGQLLPAHASRASAPAKVQPPDWVEAPLPKTAVFNAAESEGTKPTCPGGNSFG